MVQELLSMKHIAEPCAMDILFRFKIRTVTHLCNKTKASLFKTTYKSQEQIQELLMSEVMYLLYMLHAPIIHPIHQSVSVNRVR